MVPFFMLICSLGLNMILSFSFPCKIDLERTFYQAGSHIVVFSVAANVELCAQYFRFYALR